MRRSLIAVRVSIAACLATGLLVLGTTPAGSAAPEPSKRAGGSPSQGEAVVDVNKATAQELANVPGIGPSIAGRIVEFREKNGPYERLEDLMKVRGIGEKSFQKLRPHLTVTKAR